MSAVLDTLKKDAVRREASGFATMHGDPLDAVIQYGNYTSSVSHTFVGSGTSAESRAVIAYTTHGAPHRVGFSGQEGEPEVFGVIRSANFVVRSMNDAATMGPQSTLWVVEAIEHDGRGVVVVNTPRKRIHSEVISVCTADLPRKRPRIVLSDRLDEEENA